MFAFSRFRFEVIMIEDWHVPTDSFRALVHQRADVKTADLPYVIVVQYSSGEIWSRFQGIVITRFSLAHFPRKWFKNTSLIGVIITIFWNSYTTAKKLTRNSRFLFYGIAKRSRSDRYLKRAEISRQVSKTSKDHPISRITGNDKSSSRLVYLSPFLLEIVSSFRQRQLGRC